jgi:hypothetical protein
MATKNLELYVKERNFIASLFGGLQIDLKFLTRGAKAQLLADIDTALSPENLTCDGEAPAHAVRAKAQRLLAAKAELETLMAV